MERESASKLTVDRTLANGLGEIDFEEFWKWWELNKDRFRARAMFDQIDDDGNGTLDRDELQALLACMTISSNSRDALPAERLKLAIAKVKDAGFWQQHPKERQALLLHNSAFRGVDSRVQKKRAAREVFRGTASALCFHCLPWLRHHLCTDGRRW